MEAPVSRLVGVSTLLRGMRIASPSAPPYVAGSFQDEIMMSENIHKQAKRRQDERLTQSANDLRQAKRHSSPAESSRSLPPSRSESRTDLTASVICAPTSPVSLYESSSGGSNGSASPNGLVVTPHIHYRTQPSHRLNPHTEVYGLDGLRLQLENYVLTVLEGGDELLPDHASQHIFWSFTPYGSGVFTLVDNFCRYHSINLLHVSTRAPRNNVNFCLEVPYEDGRYQAIMAQALSMAPCILFIDRIDPHFSTEYETRGLQLIDNWDSITESSSSAGGAVPRVWTVISASDSLADLYHKWPINPFSRLSRWETIRAPLDAKECVGIVMQTIAAKIVSSNIQADDRPAPVGENAPEEALHTFRVQTENSVFLRLLHAQRKVAEPVAKAFHSHVLLCTPPSAPIPFSVEPWWLHTAVVDAFRLAAERFRTLRRASPHGTQLDRKMLLPTKEDLIQGLKRLPTPFVREFRA